MVHGRREIAPKEQIKALRHARDHYVQLAEQIHNDTKSAWDSAERQLREDDARRIAKAYDRSLSNSVARLSGMEGTHRSATRSLWLWYRIGALLILAGLLPFAYRYAPSLDGFLNRREIRTVASSGAPATSAPPAETLSPDFPEQAPLAKEPAAPKRVEPAAPKPAIALAAPAPKNIVPPRAPVTKKVVPRETTNPQPAPAKQAVQTPAETATASTPAPATPALTQPAQTQPAPAQPAPAQPAQTQPAPAAPPPAPVAAPQVAAATPPPATIPPAPTAIRPEPVMETHTLPRYPQLSAQIGEAGTTKMSVAISPQGRAADCRITQSSGSERLDSTACAHVTDNWRWKPVNRDSTAPAPRVSVTMVWNLSRPNRGR
jgi:TonB family protein